MAVPAIRLFLASTFNFSTPIESELFLSTDRLALSLLGNLLSAFLTIVSLPGAKINIRTTIKDIIATIEIAEMTAIRTVLFDFFGLFGFPFSSLIG